MIKNEQGFTYPLTLSVLIIFLLFFSIRVEQLLSERKMARETKKILVQEYYMLSSAKKLEKSIQKGETLQSKGIFSYKYGKMNFQTNLPLNNVQEISFTLHLDTGEISKGIGYYDIDSKKMVNWIEKN